jgi:DNA-binding sugar fermentation-stimulating protein
LGRGTQGIVYLYQNADDPSKKLALKVARLNNRLSTVSINSESNFHKRIWNTVGHKKYFPKYLGQTYFKEVPVIKSEYIDFSVEEYLQASKSNKSFIGI